MAMDYVEIVKKLIGNVQPAGASHIDGDRCKNLVEMCLLVNELIIEIDNVACQKDSKEHSVKVMGEYAYNFLTKTIGIVE